MARLEEKVYQTTNMTTRNMGIIKVQTRDPIGKLIRSVSSSGTTCIGTYDGDKVSLLTVLHKKLSWMDKVNSVQQLRRMMIVEFLSIAECEDPQTVLTHISLPNSELEKLVSLLAVKDSHFTLPSLTFHDVPLQKLRDNDLGLELVDYVLYQNLTETILTIFPPKVANGLAESVNKFGHDLTANGSVIDVKEMLTRAKLLPGGSHTPSQLDGVRPAILVTERAELAGGNSRWKKLTITEKEELLDFLESLSSSESQFVGLVDTVLEEMGKK